MTTADAASQSTRDRPENPYARAYANFVRETERHRLTVLHEDGVYRHLRVQTPGTRNWSWDITTWPGHLATSGDIADGYMFAREHDMVGFFTQSSGSRKNGYYSDGAPSIDFRYWAEKLCGRGSRDVKEYSAKLFLQFVREHLDEHEAYGSEAQAEHEKQLTLLRRIHELRGLDSAASRLLLETHWEAEERQAAVSPNSFFALGRTVRDVAREALSELWSVSDLTDEKFEDHHDELETLGYFELAGRTTARQSPAERAAHILEEASRHSDGEDEARLWLRDDDDARAALGEDAFSEGDFREYDIHFLFACYAIELSMRLYQEHIQKHGTNDTYVLVRGGLVQNRPSQPVIDFDVLDVDRRDRYTAKEALVVREQIMTLPQARRDLLDAIAELTELIEQHGDESVRERLAAALADEAQAATKRATH